VPGGATVTELAQEVHLPRATVGRLLATLADAGLAEQAAAGRWVLGYELVRLARTADPDRRLIDVARPLLAALAAEVGESAMVGVGRWPGEGEVVVQVDAPSLVGATTWVGRRFAAHASAGGKCALAQLGDGDLARWLAEHPLERLTGRTIADPGQLRAELARVRRRGWAETVDELEEGVAGIAVPVAGPDPSELIALGVSGPTSRFTAPRRKELAQAAQVTAARLSERLGV
jgi:DNA-binding IclR family transcriptional regulator